jgi:hypothetical protein
VSEQLTIDGGSVPTGPPPVPPAWLGARIVQQRLPKDGRPPCVHCVMTDKAMRAHRSTEQALPEPWKAFLAVTWPVLQAVFCITQSDGSTLHLCAQHAAEHAKRGQQHG